LNIAAANIVGQGTSIAFETRDARGEAVIERGWIIG